MTEEALAPPSDEAVGVQRSHLTFPVVGIGASAGGLGALMRFFEALPADAGMAYVVILHPSPKHPSHAAEILQRSSSIPVRQVHEPVAIEVNHAYVIPPTHQLSMSDGQLRLMPDVRTYGRHQAIDVFFRTLAHAHAEHGIGIVLSGTGADGAVGIARIKEQGGMTVAQAPDDAEHDDMPRAAIATGQVDFVLAASEMPAKLAKLAQNGRAMRMPADMAERLKVRPSSGEEAASDEQALRDVMSVLRNRTQHDFRHYKRATVLRRIERRLQVTGRPSLASYRDHLLEHPQETQPLLQDMLISVTNFFRDRDAFEALERDVLPTMLASLRGQPLRAWVAGCATGEEAYSIAMLLQEGSERLGDSLTYQVFATDIDDRALRTARLGIYPASVAGDLPPALLRQFMAPEQNQYRVTKPVRDRVLFANHNVLRDPPFSRVQLIACRNLLIYLDREAQARVLETFRYALAPGGVLFLGSSESVEVVSDLFVPLDKRHRLYKANPTAHWQRPGSLRPLTDVSTPLPAQAASPAPAMAPVDKRASMFAELHQRALRQLVPASALLGADLNILHLSDGASRFLQPQTGVPSLNLVANLHPSLRLEARAALFKAQHTGEMVQTRVVRPHDDGGQTVVHLVVRPFTDPETQVDTVLVSLEETQHDAPAAPGVPAGPRDDAVIDGLAAENQRLKQRLQETLEQAETSTEELRASNEELQAINEELRSATEELETSKEELQSVNEELTTVNFELGTKVEETTRVNDDLSNFIASTDIATVFVDGGLRIKRYTPPAAELFSLIASDVGRSLLDITHKLDYPQLTADAESAFSSLRAVEREVRGKEGGVFLSRILPYRTGEDRIDGVVLTFIDISALREAEAAARAGEEQLRIAVESTKDFAIAITDLEGRVTHWNSGAERIFGYTAAEIVGQPLAWVFTEEDQAQGVPQAEMRTASEAGRAEDERWHRRKDGSRFYCSGVMTLFDTGQLRGFCKMARDMTGIKRDQLLREALLLQETQSRRKAQAAADSKDEFLAVMSHELKHPLNLISINAELLSRLPQVRSTAPALRAAHTIQRTVAAQAKIVDDLLDLSRARTGKLTLQLSDVDWAATVSTIVEAVRPDAEAKGIALSLGGADLPLFSSFDRVRAEQVVWNLLSNALKFTGDGGRIDVRLAVERQEIHLSVTDTGKGISPAFIGHVFEMFSQEASFERRREGGLGVGLALVRELVTAHGGRVAAASPGIGQGATFSLWVPRIDGPASGVSSTEPADALQGLKLLLVDDSDDTVSTLGTLLRLSGADVQTATSGAEALELVRAAGEAPFDVLVSDVSMPDMSGLDLIGAVRALPLKPQPLGIACSGYSRAQDAQRAQEAGFDAALAKPLVLAELEGTIRRLRALRLPGPAAG